MSKGSKNVIVRMPAELLAQVEEALASRNEYARGELWTLSDFVRDCVRERLNKKARRKGSRRPARVPLGDEVVTLGRGE